MAQHPPVVGVVAISSDASSGTIPLSAGSTIYSGESIRTAKTGRLQIRVGGVQLALAPSIAARIFRSGELIIVHWKAFAGLFRQILAAPLSILC